MLRFRLHLSLFLLDLTCIYASFFLAGLLYPNAGADHWIVIGSSIATVYLATAFGARAYSTEVIVNPARGVARSMQALIVAAAAVVFLAFSLKSSEEFSRVIFALGLTGSTIALVVVRTIFLHQARSFLGGSPYNVVLITDATSPPSGEYSMVLPTAAFDPGEDCPIMYDRLATSLKAADRVIVDCAPDNRMAWVHALQGANIQAEILAPELNAITPIALARFGDTPTLIVAKGPLSLPDRLLKRLFDLAIAGIALLFLAPVLLATALAIAIESRGPILFVQTRIGRGNQMFRIFKFRSMRAERSDGKGDASTAREDDRVTRVGRFIRKTSIDELPQLLNVLIGDMSIVGPRPHALGSKAEDQLFWEIDERYWHRHGAKPGLTGLAQVRGYRGATDHRDDLTNRLKADLEYLHEWSLWRDIKIIAMTFGVLVHKNAF
jgi:lipopolysaccharide/colanic/teichoic acid biosynthesis glycosyltransferase